MNLSRGDKVAKYMAELTRIGAVVVIRGGMPRKSSYLVRRQPPAGYDGPLKITDWTASFGEVVYYVRRASGDIKIGTTAGPALHRVAQLRRVHGDVDILATEPGGVDVEEHRHRQFAAERLDGEWFRPGAHLLAHIATLAGTPLRVGGGL